MIVPIYISKHSYFDISDIKLDLDSIKSIDIYHDSLDGVGIVVYYKDGTVESFGNDYHDSFQDTIYTEDSYGFSHDLRALMNPNSSYKDFTFIDFWDWEEFCNPLNVNDELGYLNYYYPIKKKRRNREKDSHKYKAKHKRYQDKYLNLYNDDDYLEEYFEKHPLPNTSVKKNSDLILEELFEPVTPSNNDGILGPRGTGKTTPASIKNSFDSYPQFQVHHRFHEAVQITFSDLHWKSLVDKDSKYHRPKSNDIFYRRHKRKNK